MLPSPRPLPLVPLRWPQGIPRPVDRRSLSAWPGPSTWPPPRRLCPEHFFREASGPDAQATSTSSSWCEGAGALLQAFFGWPTVTTCWSHLSFFLSLLRAYDHRWVLEQKSIRLSSLSTREQDPKIFKLLHQGHEHYAHQERANNFSLVILYAKSIFKNTLILKVHHMPSMWCSISLNKTARFVGKVSKTPMPFPKMTVYPRF